MPALRIGGCNSAVARADPQIQTLVSTAETVNSHDRNVVSDCTELETR
jgi:hypothetical protein